jgi:phage shock protein E
MQLYRQYHNPGSQLSSAVRRHQLEAIKRKMSKMLTLIIGVSLVVILLFVWKASQRSNSVLNTTQLISPASYMSEYVKSNASHVLLDVRTAQEFASGAIPGARNIPVEALAQRLHEVPTDRPVIVYCRSGRRSQTATQILAQAGFTQLYDLGGIIQWQAQGLPVQ